MLSLPSPPTAGRMLSLGRRWFWKLHEKQGWHICGPCSCSPSSPRWKTLPTSHSILCWGNGGQHRSPGSLSQPTIPALEAPLFNRWLPNGCPSKRHLVWLSSFLCFQDKTAAWFHHRRSWPAGDFPQGVACPRLTGSGRLGVGAEEASVPASPPPG